MNRIKLAAYLKIASTCLNYKLGLLGLMQHIVMNISAEYFNTLCR